VQALHQIQAGLPMSIPEPAAQAEGDDWEAAWSRSGNIAEQLG
jgi:hypothetical protein